MARLCACWMEGQYFVVWRVGGSRMCWNGMGLLHPEQAPRVSYEHGCPRNLARSAPGEADCPTV
eukprot:1493099-Lingulodinium_polyedra.AAC.1